MGTIVIATLFKLAGYSMIGTSVVKGILLCKQQTLESEVAVDDKSIIVKSPRRRR